VRSETRGGDATVRIRTEVENHGKGVLGARVLSTILDPAGKVVGKAATLPEPIGESGEHIYEQQVAVKSPALWSLEQRNLYKLVTEIEVGGAIADRYETPFGIRTCAFDAEKGFFLNGQSVKFKGTCNHQDHAGVGAAVPDAVQYFRVRKLQEMGCNALRTSHNPPTPELLNAADELGMLVFDETRMMSSNPEGLNQFENLVRRDRNHPSVFMWSMGNEEGAAATDKGLLILTAMKAVSTKHDGSRLVSIAPLGGNNMGKFGFAACDVQGYNYADPAADAFHKLNPTVPVMGTEQVSAVATRGIYVMDPQHGFVGSYDPYTTTGRASCEGWWSFCNARPWLAGGFIWTGSTTAASRRHTAGPTSARSTALSIPAVFRRTVSSTSSRGGRENRCCICSRTGTGRGTRARRSPSGCTRTWKRWKLFLNGQSLGRKDMKKDSHLAWNVTYAPGTIEARGYKDGKQVMTAKRETAGPAARLVLTADRTEISADGEDVAMFAVEVQDSQGRVVPTADNQVSFRVYGEGRVIGVGNGDPTSQESDKGSSRKTFSGLCMAIVQSTKTAGTLRSRQARPDWRWPASQLCRTL